MPPANGKKLWRVKRAQGSHVSLDALLLLECLNSSLRISAAAKKFVTRRPPSRRPKAKPGMRKDFVFVDLSPVRSEESEKLCDDVSLLTSLPVFDELLPLNLSMSSVGSLNFADDLLSEDVLGLGLGCDFGNYTTHFADQPSSYQPMAFPFPAYPCPHEPVPQYTPAPQMPQQTLTPPSTLVPLLPEKPKKKSAGGFQFKTYTGPSGVKKPRKPRRTMLEPTKSHIAAAAAPQSLTPPPSTYSAESDFLYEPALYEPAGLDDFLHIGKDMGMAFTPPTDFSENEDDLRLYEESLFTPDFGFVPFA